MVNPPSLSSVYSAPTSFRGAAPPGSSQSQAIPLDSDYDSDDGLADAPEATQNYNTSSFEIYGVLHSKIVGVRFYSGVASIGEMVVLRREPQNRYDSNAIQVLNVRHAQIGHIPRQVASKLAGYLDDKSLLVEASISGPKGEFDCPVELRLYGTDDPRLRGELKARMQADRLPIGHMVSRVKLQEKAQKEREKQQEKLDKERRKAIELAKRAAKMNGGAVVGMGNSGAQFSSRGLYAAGMSNFQERLLPISRTDASQVLREV
jgi:SWI/SNF-related matrix-associated actin-dependent regulator of chromatin subfamily A3